MKEGFRKINLDLVLTSFYAISSEQNDNTLVIILFHQAWGWWNIGDLLRSAYGMFGGGGGQQ